MILQFLKIKVKLQTGLKYSPTLVKSETIYNNVNFIAVLFLER